MRQYDTLQWLDTFGEPKAWALALALMEQIDDFKRAATVVQDGLPPDWDEAEAVMGWALDRLKKPVVDIEAARRDVLGHEESGGWGAFTSGDDCRMPDGEIRNGWTRRDGRWERA